MLAYLDHIEDIALGIKTFWFKSSLPVDYVAGQYIELFLPHENSDARGQNHWFTLSSCPSEDLIAITTKFAAGRTSTFKQKLLNLTPGTEVELSAAMGDFVLPKNTEIPLIFVAGGIGVTPVRSMVKWLADNNEKRDIHIIYAVQSKEEIAYQKLFEAYGAKLNVVLTGPEKSTSLNSRLVLELAKPSLDSLIYISGPELMVEKLENELLADGIKSAGLVLDFYPGYPET